MAELTSLCVRDVFVQNRREKAENLIEYCRGMAIRTACVPKKYIEKISLPFFDIAGEIPCQSAATAYEKWMCE